MNMERKQLSKALILFMFFQLVVTSNNVRYFGTDSFQFANFFICFGVSLIYNRMMISPRIMLLIGVFGLIAIPAVVLHGADTRLYFGWMMKISTAFFLVNIYKERFWDYLLAVIQVLALISLPLYLIQLVMPEVLRILQPITDALMIRIGGHHQYAIVWRYNQWRGDPSIRNSGFMWEPSAFAAVLVWALLARLIKDKFNFNRWTYVILIAAFTTFSTGGFIGLSFLLLASMLHTKANKAKYFGLVLLVVGFLIFDLMTNVVSDNYETSRGKIDSEERHVYMALTEQAEAGSISRVAAYALGFRRISEYPFGYGYPANTDEYGLMGYSPNAFMNLFIRWGVIGISFVLLSMLMTVKFLLYQSNVSVSYPVYFSLFMALMMSFHGTTLDSQIVSLGILLFYWHLNPRLPKKMAGAYGSRYAYNRELERNSALVKG